ncbi:cation:proton antiporter [Streptomyces sp. OZ13]|uniref:cation:proton antiporter n=1 Tax=Streptomyces sp. OZ13 TaxID=3452210 RepID=UPI003F8B5FD4
MTHATPAMAQTIAALSIILVLGALLRPFMQRLRQPAVTAEILVGIALGPSLLGLLPGDLPGLLFPDETRAALTAIAQVGILLFMFLIGWDIDLGRLRRSGGTVAALSVASIAVPFATGGLLALWLHGSHSSAGGQPVDRTTFVLFVGTAMAITAFPVLARIVADNRLGGTTVGFLAVAAAAVGDILAWCMLVAVSVMAVSGGYSQLLSVAGWSAVAVLVLALVVRPVLRHVLERAARTGRLITVGLPVVAAGVFAAAWTAQWIGLETIFGAFAFGLAMPRTVRPAVKEALEVPFQHVSGLLLPVFFIATGLTVDVAGLGGAGLTEFLAILAVACAGKLAGTMAVARARGLGWRDSTVLGFLMNTRGLTELIILNAGLSMGILDTRMFTMMVCMAVVTTGMAGFVLPRPGTRRTTPAAPAAEGSPEVPAPGSASSARQDADPVATVQ